jgi:hypothetical protein
VLSLASFGAGAAADTFAYEVGTGPLVGLVFNADTGALTAAAAVPEPSQTLLLLAGLAALGPLLRSRSKRAPAIGPAAQGISS